VDQERNTAETVMSEHEKTHMSDLTVSESVEFVAEMPVDAATSDWISNFKR
jgi:hypothetical protein